MRKNWLLLLLTPILLLHSACRERTAQESIIEPFLEFQLTTTDLSFDTLSSTHAFSGIPSSPSPKQELIHKTEPSKSENHPFIPSYTPTPIPTQNFYPSPTYSATATTAATASSSPTASTLEGAVQHLDTPEKLSTFLLQEITFTDHGGCLSYWPDVFYQKREGNCKDYSTFASYVLAQHGYKARRIVYTYYRNGIRLGHEVAAYEIDGETWIMSNGHISGPFTSLNDYFQSLTHLDYVTLLCIKPPGGVTCCNP